MTAEWNLRVLVVDDEAPARAELSYLLEHDDRVAEVVEADSGAAALRQLEDDDVDAVFLDIAMPELSGLDVARLLTRFKAPPSIVFVTAHDHAVEAFEINAVDYLLKPVAAERVGEAVRRVVESHAQPVEAGPDDETIPVELGGVTRFVARSEVRYVESHGDYVRLHTSGGESHLVRVPLAVLQQRWRDAGFVRIHRQCLVALGHVTQVKQDGNHCSVVVDGTELVVSRRHTRELRELLVRRARPTART